MTLGGSLKVSNNSGNSFSVSFSRNTTITNYAGREMGKVGDTKVDVKNGQSGTSRRVYSNKTSGAEAGVTFNSNRYAIFDALRKLDGNASDVSEKDFAMAKSLKGKYGITDVRRDAQAGVTTIVCSDGNVLRFAQEMDGEKAAPAKQKPSAAKTEAPKEEGALEKFGNGVADAIGAFINWIRGE